MEEQSKFNELNSELNIVFRYLIKKGVSRVDAEDAVQETAYKYLRFSDSIRTPKVRSWLIRVALNYYYDQCRKNKNYVFDLEKRVVEEKEEELPELIILANERVDEFNQLLSRMRPLFSELILLKYESHLSYDEISELLGISTSSVKTNLYRARKKFLKLYKEDSDER